MERGIGINKGMVLWKRNVPLTGKGPAINSKIPSTNRGNANDTAQETSTTGCEPGWFSLKHLLRGFANPVVRLFAGCFREMHGDGLFVLGAHCMEGRREGGGKGGGKEEGREEGKAKVAVGEMTLEEMKDLEGGAAGQQAVALQGCGCRLSR